MSDGAPHSLESVLGLFRCMVLIRRYEDHLYRTPIKFGGIAVDRATLLNVECTVRTTGGRTARGVGSMPLGNVWSFPSKVLNFEGKSGETLYGALDDLRKAGFLNLVAKANRTRFTTQPVSKSWKGWKRCGSGRPCTSARPATWVCTTWCTK